MSIMAPRKNKIHKNKSSGIWIYGRHAVLAAIGNPRRKILKILAISAAKELSGFPIEITDNRKLAEMLPPGATHQGFALLTEPLPDLAIHEIPDAKLVLILDQITDPQNVGAILRSAAAFAVDAVIMPKDNSPPETTALAKAASGALEIVPIVKVTNLVAAMKYLKEDGFWILGLDGKAEMPLGQAPRYEKTALALGAEGIGLRRLTSENCDLLVKLPISDKMESLNVSNAAAVALYELTGQ